VERGLVSIRFRHQVDEIILRGGAVDGVRGTLLEASSSARGQASGRGPAGDFSLQAACVIVAAGGIGGNHELVRASWPPRLGRPPENLLSGVPAHVDGRMLAIVEAAGGRIVNRDRMWHYVEGVRNWNPIWPMHGIRILPGPSSLWLDARGARLPVPLFPGFDTLGTLAHLRSSGFDHSWFLLTPEILRREFALSGSEQNPDLARRDLRLLARRVLARKRPPAPVEAFLHRGEDFLSAPTVEHLVRGMNRHAGAPLIDAAELERELRARDREVENPFTKDLQLVAVRGARRYLGDRLIRVAKPHRLLDPAAGPLIAVRLRVLTRKTLGGVNTDLEGRVLDRDGRPISGLYAAGEVAGFGGGGLHGYRSLEGTFLGGCLFSGRAAGRAVAALLG
jgi:predicted oxidoreductase